MKTKLFTFLLAVVASIGTMFAWDYERVQIGDLFYNLDASNQTAEVTSQNSGSPRWSTEITTANIPASVTYNSVLYSVTSIGEYAFYSCIGLTSVTIPNSVTSIGDYAFSGCTGLTSIEIPNSVTSIGNFAFELCTSLTSPIYNAHVFAYLPTSYSGAYIIPDGIESIAGSAFYWCSDLTSVTLSNSVKSIEYGNFFSCRALTAINVAADNVNYCSEDGVLFDKDKTKIVQYPGGKQGAYSIPNGVTNIREFAFNDCRSLTSVTIPNSVTSIGNYAFRDCTGLTSVTIPNSVTSIGNAAFSGCSALTSPVYNAHIFVYMPTYYSGAYSIPDGIETIAGGAFYECRALTSIEIPNSVTSIGHFSFASCSSLTSIEIPNSVTSIGDEVFLGCTGLTSPVYNTHVFAYLPTSYSGAYTIPDGIESIAGDAFNSCFLTSVIIPNSVTSIGDEAFAYCTSLASITCEASTLPTLSPNVFSEVPKSIPLYVPAESIEAYKAADQWKDFTNIQAISTEAVQTVFGTPANKGNKSFRNGQIVILRGDRTYTLTGAELK